MPSNTACAVTPSHLSSNLDKDCLKQDALIQCQHKRDNEPSSPRLLNFFSDTRHQACPPAAHRRCHAHHGNQEERLAQPTLPQNLSIPAGADTDKPKQGQCLTGAANSNSNCTEHGLAWQRLHFCSEARETLSCPPWLCGLCSAQTSEVWVQGSFRAADQRPQAFSTERSRAGLARILSMKLFAVWHRRRPTSAF